MEKEYFVKMAKECLENGCIYEFNELGINEIK